MPDNLCALESKRDLQVASAVHQAMTSKSGVPQVCAIILGLGTTALLLQLSGVLRPLQQREAHRSPFRRLQASNWASEGWPVHAAAEHSEQHHHGHYGRNLLYSIYAGAGRAAQDIAQTHEHTASRQNERALERVRAMERGAGTQATLSCNGSSSTVSSNFTF